MSVRPFHASEPQPGFCLYSIDRECQVCEGSGPHSEFVKALFFSVLALIASPALVTAQVQTFTSNTGEIIKATLVSHAGGKVKIRRVDGREFEVDPALFCQQDEKTIRKWMIENEAAVRYAFNVKADKKVMGRNTYSSSSSETRWAYEIAITNSSQDPVTGLKVLYRVLYYNSSERMMEGEAVLDSELKFNRSMIITTTPVDIYKSRYSESDRNNELKGCLVRVLDRNGKVLLDWVSTDLGMKDRTWENTSPREEPAGGVIIR